MIALKDLSVMQILLVFLIDLVTSYPSNIYGTKQYGRATYRSSFDPYETYVRAQRYPYAYYPNYAQVYPDDYYYTQDTYPLYYIYPRTSSNYDLYQAGLPKYYQEMQPTRNKYDYYSYVDPVINDQERIVQDMEREQRERSQPIGHEIRYENDYNSDGDSTVDETNASFLNNLMLQQIYQATDKPSNDKSPYYDQYPYDYAVDVSDSITIPTKWNDVPYDRPVNVEDEDVTELKELPKKQKQRKNKERKQRKHRNKLNNDITKRSQGDVVVYTDRKPVIKDVFITEPPIPSTDGPRRDVRGQKEEVMMRPATPVRHPFSESALGMINQQEERKRSPSVYDTIRQMLEMEKKYEDEHSDEELHEPMKKRIVSSEDSLTKQLSVLKKAQ